MITIKNACIDLQTAINLYKLGIATTYKNGNIILEIED